MIGTIVAALGLFAVTNIDDVFVLLGFFADPRFSSRQVAAGQYLGIVGLVVTSVLASLVFLVLVPEYVGLLGFLPILIGLKKLHELGDGDQQELSEPHAFGGLGNVFAVATVTIANGGDNIGICGLHDDGRGVAAIRPLAGQPSCSRDTDPPLWPPRGATHPHWRRSAGVVRGEQYRIDPMTRRSALDQKVGAKRSEWVHVRPLAPSRKSERPGRPLQSRSAGVRLRCESV